MPYIVELKIVSRFALSFPGNSLVGKIFADGLPAYFRTRRGDAPDVKDEPGSRWVSDPAKAARFSTPRAAELYFASWNHEHFEFLVHNVEVFSESSIWTKDF